MDAPVSLPGRQWECGVSHSGQGPELGAWERGGRAPQVHCPRSRPLLPLFPHQGLSRLAQHPLTSP